MDFSEIEECQSKGDWEKSAVILSNAAQSLERAGVLHIAEVTADELIRQKIKKAAAFMIREGS